MSIPAGGVATSESSGLRSPRLSHRRDRIVLVVAAGLTVGCLTSFGQTHLTGSLDAFVNSASAWLIAPFVVGAVMLTGRGAAAAGLTTCLLQLVGYYVTAQLRGYPAAGSIIAFWGACALLGGPVFGVAGHVWRRPPPRLRGLGAAVLASAFLAEGAWSYLHELHYTRTAALWIGIGAGIAILSARTRLSDLGWLGVTLPIGLVAEIALGAIYSQAF